MDLAEHNRREAILQAIFLDLEPAYKDEGVSYLESPNAGINLGDLKHLKDNTKKYNNPEQMEFNEGTSPEQHSKKLYCKEKYATLRRETHPTTSLHHKRKFSNWGRHAEALFL